MLIYLLILPFLCSFLLASESRYYVYDSSEWRAIAEASFHIRDDPLETLEPALNFGAGPAVNLSQGNSPTYRPYYLLTNLLTQGNFTRISTSCMPCYITAL